MTTLREAAQQALEALEGTTDFIRDCHHVWAAVAALRAALEEPDASAQFHAWAVAEHEKILKEQKDPVAYHGWVLRDVLFDNGEPIAHRGYQLEKENQNGSI